MGLITPVTVKGACVPQYVRNEIQARFQINAIPLNLFSDEFAAGWEVYFPRPFQILGLFNSPLGNVPNSPPMWERVYPSPLDANLQNTYSNISFLLMMELAFANMRPYDETHAVAYPVEYIRPGAQGRDYRGYFTRFLNDELISNPNQWFNTFIMPVSQFKSFALGGAAYAQDVWEEKHRALLTFIEKTSDQRLYGAPGVYRIQNTGSQWSFFQDNEYFYKLES